MVSSIDYKEYNPKAGSQASDWDFNVYWESLDNEGIRHHLFYRDDGIDVTAATKGYTQSESQEGIYIKNINNGKVAYVCLINSKIFMRIVIQRECADYDALSRQLIEYALEIKNIANFGDTQ